MTENATGLRLLLGDVTYAEIDVTRLEAMLGVRRAFRWVDNGHQGFVALLSPSKPPICSCDSSICKHRVALRDYCPDDPTPPPIAAVA